MIIKLLQLNINADNYWTTLASFLTRHTFDIIQFQEVTGKNTVSGNVHSMHDVYADLQKLLKGNYRGEMSIAQRFSSSPHSYFGNATFYKKAFSLIEKKELILFANKKLYPSDAITYEGEGRKVLHLRLKIGEKEISFMNVHFAWAKTPREEPHQTEQGKILLEYLQTVFHPVIISGDFNLDPQQPVIQKLNVLARNLITEHNITNTLNPRTHRAKNLFPSGVAVDYIFTSRDITVKNFNVLEEDISDHFGLIAELKF